MAEWDAEVEVDEALAGALIAEQFPALERGPLRRVGEGWDNVVWATSGDVAFRFPRRQIAVAGVQREIAVLPALAPRLPLAIPDAAYAGSPSARFAWPWFGSRLIAGREIAEARLDDDARVALAPALGTFLHALHDVELDEAAALPADPMRRTDMTHRAPLTRTAVAAIAHLWSPSAAVEELLARSERLAPAEATVLAHGDLHVRHLLVDEAGALSGVIDWGDCCRADPSLDLWLYWCLLPPAGRDAFLAAYGPVEEDALLRARVLALFSGAMLVAYAHAQGLRELEREALDGLRRTLDD